MAGRYDDLSEKSRGYAEGIVGGFAAAQRAVEKLTGGLVTLNMPKEVHAWDDVIRELRGYRRRMSLDILAPDREPS